MHRLLFLMPLLPFVGFLVCGLGGRRLPRAAVSAFACAGPWAAFAVAVLAFVQILGADGVPGLRQELWTWIAAGPVTVPFAFSLDRLSGVMALVVTGVGSLIHVYSTGYMKEDPGYARFFAYLNLFLAAMLVLVLADNIALLFLGWEGVGLCSYLLIGFWYRDLQNCAAAVKAFVVNRIGDLAFLIGIFWIFRTFGTYDFAAINGAVAGKAPADLYWIALLLFIGATGKSAQIPLYVWLPDAMAGPTPVSALIHAATMVTSGIYMVARLAPLYTAAPDVLLIVATIGGLTAVLAALIAFTQNDIKKVLAYSTVSQLGYMFLAAGVGAYGVAIFHVVTHAFFKALLFLGAGAVIHSLHHEQDMTKMGGLARPLPQTTALFVIGALALAGFPLTAGFFSKDEILHVVHQTGAGRSGAAGTWLGILWIAGLATAFATACYTFRQVSLVFLGKYRDGGHHAPPLEEIHESPLSMRAPLYILAALSLAGGFLPLPHFLEAPSHTMPGEAGKIGGMVLGGAIAVAGIAAGLWLFLRSPAWAVAFFERNAVGRRLRDLSREKFYVDELYRRVVVVPLDTIAELLFYLVDRLLINFLIVGGCAHAMRLAGQLLRKLQTGKVPAYVMLFLCGVLAVLFLMLRGLQALD